jgi:hypothetical protein
MKGIRYHTFYLRYQTRHLVSLGTLTSLTETSPPRDAVRMAPRGPEPTEGPDACRVWKIKTLGRAEDAKARALLEKTAWQVQPIMRARGWRAGAYTIHSPASQLNLSRV